MELGNGDPSAAAGIAQVGPAGDPILLPTPSLQTNFSPTSLAFWQEAYAEMAGIQAAAGLSRFCSSAKCSGGIFRTTATGHRVFGMPFYDAWNAEPVSGGVRARDGGDHDEHGESGGVIRMKLRILPAVIGNFTNAIMTFVRATLADVPV